MRKYTNASWRTRKHENTEPGCHNYSTSGESPWLHFKALWLTVANDEHSDEEQETAIQTPH